MSRRSSNSVRRLRSRACLSTTGLRWLVGFVGALAWGNSVVAGELRLEFEPRLEGEKLILGERYSIDGERDLNVSRLDFIVSGFALKPKGEDWMEASSSLVGLVRTDRSQLTVDLGSVPAGDYEGLRFVVGVPAELNNSDPALYPAAHALHPVTSGLHWGWTGGYVFMALEGGITRRGGEQGGFSYHLANEGNQTQVELPVSFSTRRQQTLQVPLEVESLIGSLDPWSGKTFTHSREGDEVAGVMTAAVAEAFGEPEYRAEIYQVLGQMRADAGSSPSDAYTLKVSSRFPKLEIDPSNPLTNAGVALGEALFEDPILSVDGSVSCISCHDPAYAFSDTVALSQGIGGKTGRRNSMPLVNLAWGESFFWDGRVATLAEQALHPIVDPNEMGETLGSVVEKLSNEARYGPLFTAAFGSDEVRPELIGRAIEQYLITLVSQDSRFDRAMRGETELTDQEKEGFSLFVTEYDPEQGLRGADCFHCHGGTLFVSKDFANNGLAITADDLGRFAVSGQEKDTGSFKVPTLRNIALTAPYMHDGRFSSLEEVVEHYNSQVVRGPYLDPNLSKHPSSGLQLTEEEKAALVAFLKTLTEDRLLNPEAVFSSDS